MLDNFIEMEIVFFNNKTKKFFEKTEDLIKSQVGRSFKLLRELGHNLGMPFSRSLGKGLFELRIVGIVHIRFIYCFHQDKIWMLHGFVKKTNKISKQDIDYAHKQLKVLLA